MTSEVAFGATVIFFIVVFVMRRPVWDRECQCFYLTRNGNPLKTWPIEWADLCQLLIDTFTVISGVLLALSWFSKGMGTWDLTAQYWGLSLYVLQVLKSLLWVFEKHTSKWEIVRCFIFLTIVPVVEVCVFSTMIADENGRYILDFSTYMLYAPFLNAVLSIFDELVFQPIARHFRPVVPTTLPVHPVEKVDEAKPTVVPASEASVEVTDDEPDDRNSLLINALGLSAQENLQGLLMHAVRLMSDAQRYPDKYFSAVVEMLLDVPDTSIRRKIIVAINSLWFAVVGREKFTLSDEGWNAIHQLVLSLSESELNALKNQLRAGRSASERLEKLIAEYNALENDEDKEEDVGRVQ